MQLTIGVTRHTPEEHIEADTLHVPRKMCYRPAALPPYFILKLRPVALRPSLSRGLLLAEDKKLSF